MTREETTGMLTLLKTAYPGFYAKKSKDELNLILNLWSEMFETDNAVLVRLALKELISSHAGYPPDIATVKEKIRTLTDAVSGEPTNEELWLSLKTAAANGASDTLNQFNALPPVVKRYLGSPGTLREYALMNADTFNSVIHGQFLKSISIIRERERCEKMISPQVRAMLTGKTAEGQPHLTDAPRQLTLPFSNT